jgi:hypothetical protein
MTQSADETWLREALARVGAEISLFSKTFAAFLFRPGRSARQWRAGERDFMNPLAFAAAAAGVYWAITNLLIAVWPVAETPDALQLTDQLSAAVGPYLHYGLLGVAMHLGLLALGERHRILGSLGAAFFAGGSIGTLTALLLTTLARWYAFTHNTTSLELTSGDVLPLVVFGGSVISYLLICTGVARGVGALQRTARWKLAMATVFAMLVTAVLFGTVLADGAYGWRPYIGINRSGGIGFSFGFRG